MSGRKTWALTVLIWGAMATWAHADPSSFLWDWRAWVSETGVKDSGLPGLAGSGNSPNPTPQTNIAPVAPFSANANTPLATPTPTPPPPPTPTAPPSSTPPIAYLDFGTSAYPEQSVLTVGTAQPWYTSPAVAQAFGHTPTAQEQQGFINAVVQDVQHTFAASGLTGANTVSLTTDPNAGALHTLSVVSGLSYAPNPGAIGITDVGANGFGFIDKLSYANTADQLEWAVAHNITHELMHAFGVAVHHDQTGDYLDAATAKWSLLTDPSATLSPAAVADIESRGDGQYVSNSSSTVGGQLIDGDQELLAPVPEPATIAVWGFVLASLVALRKRFGNGVQRCCRAV